MSNRVVETLYRLRDGTTAVLRRISGAYQTNASTAEQASQRIEAANRRQRSSLSGVLASVSRLRFAYFALAGVIFGAVRSISNFARAASDQENAEVRLATAIRNGSGATEDQIQALKDLAAERQRVTRFSDEQTISAQAQLATFKLSAEQIAELTPRVQDLAEGTRRLGRDNVDLEQSAILVGKALTGNAGQLSRYGVVLTDAQRELINFGTASERVAAISEALDDNFKGLATSLTPFEQATRSTQNAIGDFRERLGAFITQSEAVQDAISGIGRFFERLGRTISENGEVIERFITGGVAAFRLLAANASMSIDAIRLGFDTMAAGVLKTLQTLAAGAARVTFGEVRQSLQAFVANVDEQLEGMAERNSERFDRLSKNARKMGVAFNDLTGAISGQGEAQERVNAATRESLDLAAEERQAQNARREAIERTSAALEKLGLDAQKIDTGISQSAQDATASLLQLAQDGEASLGVLSAAAEKVSDSFDDQELQFFSDALDRAARQGTITGDQLAALKKGLEDTDAAAEKAAGTFGRLETSLAEALKGQNFVALGEIRQEMERLAASGELTEDQFADLEAQFQSTLEALNKIEAPEGLDDVRAKAGRAADGINIVTDSAREATSAVDGLAKMFEAAFSTVRELSDGAGDALDQVIEKFNRQVFSDLGSGFAFLNKELGTITEEFERQAAAADDLIERYEAAGSAIEFSFDAQTLLNRELQLLDTSRLDALERVTRAAADEAQRLQDNIKAATESLQDELDRLEGRADEIEQRRLQRRREEIQAQLDSVGLDRELVGELQQQLSILDQIEQARRGESESQRQTENSTGRQAGHQKQIADDAERAADATERANRSRPAAPREPIRVEIDASRGREGPPEMTQADIGNLVNQLTPAIIERIRAEFRTGL